MKRLAAVGCWVVMWELATANLAGAQEMPEMPKPGKEHELLAQFAGEWDTAAEAVAAPGQEPMRCKGTESAKMVGGFWLMGHGAGDMQGTPVASLLTIGFDPKIKKYVGALVCSVDAYKR